MRDKKYMPLIKNEIKRSFNKAANTYDAAAVLQREVIDRLIERLNYIRIQPKVILDLGAGTGYSTLQLAMRYKKAKIIAFDLAEEMLLTNQSQIKKKWFDKKRYVCGDAEKLPFADNSIDLIFSSLMLHWCNDIPTAIRELERVLKPNGLLLFSTLGPDTLFELRQSWATVDEAQHVHSFLDMHHIGDFLLKAGFVDSVIDMEFITISYNEIKKILLDLKNLGTHNIATDRQKGLTGKDKFKQFIEAYEQHRNAEGFIPLTYEIIYGLGWGAKAKLMPPGEFHIPVDSIKKIPPNR